MGTYYGEAVDGLVGHRLWGCNGGGGSKLYVLSGRSCHCPRWHRVEDAADHATADSTHGVGFVVVSGHGVFSWYVNDDISLVQRFSGCSIPKASIVVS